MASWKQYPKVGKGNQSSTIIAFVIIELGKSSEDWIPICGYFWFFNSKIGIEFYSLDRLLANSMINQKTR